jgi:hypothetical protein
MHWPVKRKRNKQFVVASSVSYGQPPKYQGESRVLRGDVCFIASLRFGDGLCGFMNDSKSCRSSAFASVATRRATGTAISNAGAPRFSDIAARKILDVSGQPRAGLQLRIFEPTLGAVHDHRVDQSVRCTERRVSS